MLPILIYHRNTCNYCGNPSQHALAIPVVELIDLNPTNVEDIMPICRDCLKAQMPEK